MIKHFDKNTLGRDFVVGDIHGCFDLLNEKLVEINFNEKTDRLFSVGDLVDRGEKSVDCVKWLGKPWFHSVRGNHEQMAIDYALGNAEKYWYQSNGGQWFIDLPECDQTCFKVIFERLPIAIEVETNNGLVGIIHADCPVDDWNVLKDKLNGLTKDKFIECCLWDRFRFNHAVDYPINNISKVYFGHTPVNEAKELGNCVFIDTGAVFGHKLTIIEIQE